MTAVAAWLLVPLVLGVLSLGCGLLLEIAADVRLPRSLLLPTGFAVVVVVSTFPPLSASTASLAAPLVVTFALAGIALAFLGARPRFDAWAAGAAIAAYVAYAAPAALSGSSTFAGYIKLDDTATYLAMLDRIQDHGRSLAGLGPSTYEATLATTLDYGYPLGSFAPLGILRRLVGIDAAWLWQPYLATLGAFLALALYTLAAPLVNHRSTRALIAVVAAQPAILYGYSLWGGIKELTIAVLLATLCAAVRVALVGDSVRSVLPLAVISAAVLGTLSLGGAVWLAPLLPALVLLWRNRGLAFAARAAGAFLVVAAFCATPAIVAAFRWFGHTGAFTGESELGNLIQPLKFAQLAGIWPVGDFRTSPHDAVPTYVLVAVTVAAAVGGIAWAWTRRAWEDVIYVGSAVTAALILYELGSPWIGAKALASAAPAVMLLALLGAAALAATGRVTEAAVIALAIVGGIAWSNVLAYREVWLAPHGRLTELEAIGKRYADQGPALMTEFEPYGARHFLRRLDAEGVSELRRHVVPLQSGQPLAPQGYADIDRFQLGGLLAYRLLVLRRSPTMSRPPSAYRLVERRHWYEVWQREAAPRILRHLPLGGSSDPGGVPSCADVLQLAATRSASRLVAVPREAVITAPFSVAGGKSAAFTGDATTRRGEYGVWIGGSFVGRVAAAIDGRTVGSARHQLEWPGQLVELGTTRLAAGAHRLRLDYDVGGWRPGSHGDGPFPLGPLVLAPAAAPRLISVAPSRARSLCGRRLDWVEAVG